MKTRLKSIFLLFSLFTLFTCVDPYLPHLKGYDSLMVVEGLITDENTPGTIRLSRTRQDNLDTTVMITDATVFITDDEGNTFYLLNKGNGIYETEYPEFTASVGHTYTLHISTSEGEEYESNPCFMYAVPGIDSIWYQKHEDQGTNWSTGNTGLLISLNSEPGDENQYYRWGFTETWKFKVPYPTKYSYISETDIRELLDIHEYCWRSSKSDKILINAIYPGANTQIRGEPIQFIATEESDRLTLEYSILVKQYSISKNEYDFWEALQKANDSGGDIFDSQPFSVTGNIHNINNPNEHVLGFFGVSAIKQKRKNISNSEIAELDLPQYHYPCELISKKPSDYPPPFRTTFDEIYLMFCVWQKGYAFVQPIYIPETFGLFRLSFTKSECADCELTGTRDKPDFWVEMK